jgi:hypothetical protein
MRTKMSRLWKPLLGKNWRDPLEPDLDHYLSYKHQNQNSKFSNLQKSRHSFGPIDEVMELVQVVSKGNFINVMGKVYVYRENHSNNQLNGKSAIGHNKIFGL